MREEKRGEEKRKKDRIPRSVLISRQLDGQVVHSQCHQEVRC